MSALYGSIIGRRRLGFTIGEIGLLIVDWA